MSNTVRNTGFIAMFVLCVGVAAYAVGMDVSGPGEERCHPEMRATFQSHPVGVGTHICASALALLLGPCQTSSPTDAE